MAQRANAILYTSVYVFPHYLGVDVGCVVADSVSVSQLVERYVYPSLLLQVLTWNTLTRGLVSVSLENRSVAATGPS